MFAFLTRRSPLTLASMILATVGVAGGAAAAVHRFTVTQTAGNGSLGATTFFTSSTSAGALEAQAGAAHPDTALTYPFAMFGEYNDNSSGTFGIGLAGVSTSGYGIAAEALGPNPALYVTAKGTGGGGQIVNAGIGMGLSVLDSAASNANAAVTGQSQSGGAGVSGISSTGFGTTGTTTTGYAGVSGVGIGTSGRGGAGFLGSATGEGVSALGASGSSTHPALVATDLVGGTDLIAAYAHTTGAAQESFIVQSGSKNRSGAALSHGSDVQISGDVYVTGRVFQNCNAFPATSGTTCFEAPDGTPTTSVARTPVESTGEAHLAAGSAYVRLDPAFAATISHRAPYLVFITPVGDSRGLFVARRTPSGFEVHENAGGRSTLDFDYRIVGAPPSAREAVAPSRDPVAAPGDPSLETGARLAREARGAAHPVPAVRSLVRAPER